MRGLLFFLAGVTVLGSVIIAIQVGGTRLPGATASAAYWVIGGLLSIIPIMALASIIERLDRMEDKIDAIWKVHHVGRPTPNVPPVVRAASEHAKTKQSSTRPMSWPD